MRQFDLFEDRDTPATQLEAPPQEPAPTGPADDAVATSPPYVEPEAPSCSRSPCGGPVWDPKSSLEEIQAARLQVGTPKVRRAVLRVDADPIPGKVYAKGAKAGQPKTRPLPVWQETVEYNRPGDPAWPLAVSYGIGIDSTAVLVGLVQLWRETGDPRFRPAVITFADTGGEKISTYRYLSVLNPWLTRNGFPRVTVVGWAQSFSVKSWGSHRTLEQKCLNNHTLPSITVSAFKRSDCSITWKHEPQNHWFERYSGIYRPRSVPTTKSRVLAEIVRNSSPVDLEGIARSLNRGATAATGTGVSLQAVRYSVSALEAERLVARRPGRAVVVEATEAGLEAHERNALADTIYELPSGLKIVKAIGYDATEIERLDPEAKGSTFRAGSGGGAEVSDYLYWYPLMEWNWDRARCYAEIEAEIGVVPGKSSCFYCGAMKPEEIRALSPEDLRRAILMEQVALRGRHARGEGGGLKGLAFAWSWTDFALGRVTKGMPARAREQIAEFGQLMTEEEVARIVELADRWISASPTEPGTSDVAEVGMAWGLDAFARPRGLRAGLEGWDHFRRIRSNPGLPYDPLLAGSAP